MKSGNNMEHGPGIIVQHQAQKWAGSLHGMSRDDERSGWRAERAPSTTALVNHADELGP